MIPEGTEKAVAFEIFRHMRRVCVAGLRGKRGVSIIVHWTDRDDELMLQVGGLDSETRESLIWVTKPLAMRPELEVFRNPASVLVQCGPILLAYAASFSEQLRFRGYSIASTERQ